MKPLLSILLIAFYLPVQSQVELKPEKVKEDLRNSANSIHFVFHSYQLENELRPYHLELLPDNVLTSPPVYNNEQQQIVFDIITTQNQRQKIVDYIFSNVYKDSLSFKIDAGYILIDKPEVCIPQDQVICDFELFFESKQYGFLQLYLPLDNNQDAVKILRDIKKCFRKIDSYAFEVIIKELENNDA